MFLVECFLIALMDLPGEFQSSCVESEFVPNDRR